MAFVHMDLVKKDEHFARGAVYEVIVFRVRETGEHRIFVAKDGFGRGAVFTARDVDISDARSTIIGDLVSSLIETAKCDIDLNEFGDY